MTPRNERLLVLAVLAAIPTVLFFDVLAGTGVFYLRDVSQLHYPTKKFLRDIVLAGEFPYWNPMVGAGQPLAANPTYGVFYPLGWLVLPNLIYGLQWLALSHVYIATFATYALLRSLGVGRAAACIGAMSLGIGGYVMASLDLFPMLFGIAWLPLTCLFTRRFLHGHRPRDFALAAIFFALIVIVGEPVTVMQTGLLLGLYALFRRERRIVRDLAAVGAISVAALLVSAVQMLPAIDHFGDSVRSLGLTYADVKTWSVPPVRMLEVFFPDLLGSHRADTGLPFWGTFVYADRNVGLLTSFYQGLLLVTLAVAGAIVRVRGWRVFAATSFVALILSTGDHTPLFRLLYDAGLARSFRYPEKFVMLWLFSTVLFGSIVLDQLLRGDARIRRIAAIVALSTAAVALAAAGMTSGFFARVWGMPPEPGMLEYARSGWIAAVVRGVILALLFAALARLRPAVAVMAVGAFVLADLGPRTDDIAARMPPEFYTALPPGLEQLAPDRHAYRVFHVGQWTRNTPMRLEYGRRRPQFFVLQRNISISFLRASYGLRTAIDVDYDMTFLRATTEFNWSVWQLERLRRDWLVPLAAMSNVRYAAVYRPLREEVARTRGDARQMRPLRYIEGRSLPRYYFARQIVTIRDRHDFVRRLGRERFDPTVAFVAQPAFTPAAGVVHKASETANTARLEVEADGPAFLVMSVTPHKYWTITIDGAEVPAVVTNVGYQGVRVPAGRHIVEMRYRNPLFAAGAAVSIATLLGLAFVAFRSRRDITMRDL